MKQKLNSSYTELNTIQSFIHERIHNKQKYIHWKEHYSLFAFLSVDMNSLYNMLPTQ